MGYTHYWELKDKMISKKALEKIAVVIDKYKDIIQFEYDINKKPVISEEIIRFNGIGEYGHETFLLKYGEDFCKTNMKPYDLPVCEVLLIMKYYHGNQFRLSSDGFWVDKINLALKELDGYWNQALNNVKKEFGLEFDLIPMIDGKYYLFKVVPNYK